MLESELHLQEIKRSGDSIPGKRKIGDAQSDVPPSKVPKTFIQDENHWFPDGNVLFQIGDRRFKIHHSRLSRESSWFEALMNQRVNGAPAKPYDHQEEIDKALKSVKRVDELDLFYLDFADGPGAVQFGNLLSTMENGIDHVDKPPSFDFMVDIYETSQFFCVTRYLNYAKRFLEKQFPDSILSMTDTPSPHAARGLILGLDYRFSTILGTCYYDLARARPRQLPDDGESSEGESDDDGYNNSNHAKNDKDDDSMSRTPVYSAVALPDVPNTALFCLLDIQKELVLAWNRVWETFQFTNCKCGSIHRAHSLVKKTKARYPFDPIMGIHTLLLEDSALEEYCPAAKNIVREMLQLERESIWLRIKCRACHSLIHC